VATWVAEALSRTERSKIRRSELPALLEHVRATVPEDPWRVLKSIERDFRSSDRLDLRALAIRIANGDVPAELLAEASQVQVSTIHRAKGLEFDNVVLVNADDLLPGGADQDDAAVAYVALTRPRDQIMTARCALPRNLRVDKGTGRWIVAGHKQWQTFGFEVRGVDTRAGDPVDHGLAADSLQVGAPVRLKLDPLRSTMEVPVYSVLLDDRTIARTSPRFGELLARRVRSGDRRRVPWPALNGLAVDSLETVGVPSPLGGGPLIGLGVRVSGLAMLDWGNDRGANIA
jgi:DNA helicase-2/ATP-dependent DNA helicase PcrA